MKKKEKKSQSLSVEVMSQTMEHELTGPIHRNSTRTVPNVTPLFRIYKACWFCSSLIWSCNYIMKKKRIFPGLFFSYLNEVAHAFQCILKKDCKRNNLWCSAFKLPMSGTCFLIIYNNNNKSNTYVNKVNGLKETDFNLFKTVHWCVNTIRSWFVTFIYIFPFTNMKISAWLQETECDVCDILPEVKEKPL